METIIGAWKFVPVEPTEEMIDAARVVAGGWCDGFPQYAEGYAAMLAAAPLASWEFPANADLIQALEIVLEREQITSATRALIEHTLRRAKGG